MTDNIEKIVQEADERAANGPRLRGCPFCGGTPKEHDRFNSNVVTCRSCGAKVKQSAMGQGDAAERWNRRAALASAPVAYERALSVALRAIAEYPTPGEGSMSAVNMREIARAALASVPISGKCPPAPPAPPSLPYREVESGVIKQHRNMASAPVADRQRLRELVDVVWNEATESTAVPDTPWADRLIDKVFPSLAASAPVAGEAQRLYSLGEVPNPMVEALRAAIEGECDGLDLSDQKARYVLASMMNCGLIHAAPQASESVRDALQKLVDMYVLNQGSGHEHITCYTPLPASHLTPKQRAKSETWKAWDDARAALSAQPGKQQKENDS